MMSPPDSYTSDQIDKMPLSIVPLSNSTLKSAQLVKNSQLETMVELHSGSKSGSLQIRPQDIAKNFSISKEDQATIDKLATLQSYDVYSLRINLERLGIPVDEKALDLSDSMKARLAHYTAEFTHPLILNIFGDGSGDQNNSEELQKLFRDPDVRLVQSRLRLMAQKTGLTVEEIPAFLKSYGDLFLSGTYYRHNFEGLLPDIERMALWFDKLKSHREVASSQSALASCKNAEESLKYLCASITERLVEFKSGFESFWTDTSKKNFQRLRRQVEDKHSSMGAVLCGVTVIVRDWAKTFPDNNSGGISSRLKYVTSRLEPGFRQLKDAETNARAA